MKKLFAVLMTVVLLLSLALVGCSGKTENTNNDASDPSSVEKGDDSPLKLTVMAATFGASPAGTQVQLEWQKRMEAHIGRKLDIEWKYIPWGEYGDKFKLTLASGDLPDIMTNKSGDLATQYGRQGVVLDIAPYLEKYAPNYKKFVDSTPNAKSSLYTPEGNMYFFGDGWSNKDNNEGTVYGPIYRFDEFKKHNIKIPETMDEFYNAAKQLKGLYPDVYPVTSFPWPKAQEGFMYMNHTSAGIYWNGKQFAYGPVEDAYKEALMFVAKLYKEKLLDPEIFTQSDDQVKQKATTGKAFMIPLVWFGSADEFNSNQKDMEWGGSMIPKNEKYGTPWKMGSVEPGQLIRPYNGLLISAKAKNPELLVKMIDYQYSDEMIDLVNWGIEGVTYEVKDGKKQYLPEILNADIPQKVLEPYGTGGSSRSGLVFTPQEFGSDVGKYKPMPFFVNGEFVNEKAFVITDKTGGKESIAPMDREPSIKLSKEEQASRNEVMTPIDTYVEEMTTKFIIGEKSFDEWDSYKAEILKLGDYTAILKLMNDKVAALQ